MIDKEKPAPTARERLARVMDALEAHPHHQYPFELVDSEPAVYLNYDFETAVVIEVGNADMPEYDGMYVLIAMSWGPDHGVTAEHFIGTIADADMAAMVAVAFAKARETI